MLLGNSLKYWYRYCATMVLVVLSVIAVTGDAFAATTYDFSNLGVASGGFKPQGNRFLVSELFAQEDSSAPTAIYYNDQVNLDVSGITIKADSVNLISFDLTDMDFIYYTDETITSITVTGTKTDNTTVTATATPGLGAIGSHFTLTGKGAVLTNFTNLKQLQFRIVMADQNVACVDFASITLANEVHEVITTPTTPASAMQAYKTGDTEVALSWTKGNGNSRLVFAKQGATSGVPALVDGTTYASNADFSAATDPDSDGWKCVYSGNANYALISGLAATTQYRFVVFEYNGYSGAEKYLQTTPAALNQATLGSFGTWSSGDILTLNAENFWTWTDADRDSSGNTYVAHRYDQAGLMDVEKWNGTAWSTLTSFTPASAGYTAFSDHSSIAVTGTDQFRLAFQTDLGIAQAKYDGSAWAFENVVSSAGLSTPLISVDGNGNSHILYEYVDSVSSPQVQYIRLASWNGSSWGSQTFSTISGYGGGNEVKKDYLLLNDANKKQHVFYFRETSANVRDLHHWTNSSGSWVDETIFTGNADAPYKLYGAFDSSGKIHLTYTNNALLGKVVMYLTNKSGSWVSQPLIASSAGWETGYTATELRINGSGDMAIPLRLKASVSANNAFKVLLKQGSNPWYVSTLSPLAPDYEDDGNNYTVTGVTFRDDGKVMIAYANQLPSRPRKLMYSVVSLYGNTAPAFVGATSTLTVNQNAGATDITGLLHVSDTDPSQTETWSQSAAPDHGGTLSFSSAMATSGTTDITPGGTITYTPANGYSGTETFTVQVSDGTATATRTITVTVVAPPTATTGSAGSISATGATLNGTVNDNGASTMVTFDYGTTTGYGTNVAATTGGTVGAGAGSTATAVTISSLTCNTTYHFRVNGQNSAGTTNGSDAMFTTSKCPQTITFSNPGTQNFGTTPILSATSTSTLAPTFTSSTTGVCTITSGGLLTFVAAGTCTINADQAGTGTYVAAPTVSQSFTVAAVVPGAPTIGIATPGDTQASVAFTAPASNGGASITGYTVTSNPGGLTGSGASSPITVSGLTNGTAYTFTVTATNSAGTGSASAASNSITPAAAQTITFTNPGAQNFGTTPTLTATATSSLTVTFTSSTTGVCTVTTGGALTFVSIGTCTINADQAGNGNYFAAPTVTRSFAVVAVVPGAPAIGIASGGDTQTSVTFTPPTSNGGATITGYTVTANPGGVTATGASSPITVTGLTNGISYTFTVTATNSAGTGSASSASNSVTPNPGPTVVSVAVPANGIYKAGSNLDFTVTWDSNVTVTGTPRITLGIGVSTVYATYQSGSGTVSTLFRYTVLPGQTDNDGITAGALSLNGGTIRNSSGTDATLTLNSVASTVNVLLDTTAPTLSSIATSNPNHSGGTLTATANENALGSWIAVASGATAPNVAQVLAGADYGGVTVVAHGSGALSAGSAVSFSLAGLDAGTSYDIYLAAQDSAGNPSAAVSSVTLITTTTRVVTSSSDSGAGSLRDTITSANPGDAITFDAALNSQTITLASSLTIAKDLIISGTGAGNLTISGNNTVQIFQVSAGVTFILEKLTLANGTTTDGGALMDSATSTTTITGCVFSGNRVIDTGGAINSSGTMTVSDTLFSNNSADVNSGAIASIGTLNLTNVTLYGNSAPSGGAITSGGTATITNATIVGNSAIGNGGGIAITGGTLNLKNSIVANNTAPIGPDIAGAVTSQDYNLVRDITGATISGTTTHNVTGSDPLVGALANNGGPAQTMALLAGSPAINAADCTTGPAADQRGMTRPQDATCDMGAYERGVPATLTASAGTPQSAAPTAVFTTPLTAKVVDSLGGVLDGISVTYSGPASGAGIIADGTADTDASGIAAYGVIANGTAGSYTVRATVSSLTANFSLTNSKLDQAITFTPPATAIYGDAPIILDATGGASGNPVTFAVTSGPGSLSGNTLTITGAGPIIVTASQAGSAAYNAAADVQKTIVVGKAGQSITFNPPASATYGDGPITLSATATSGLTTTIAVTSGPGSLSGNTLTLTGVGPIVVTASQAGDGNYTPATDVQKTIVVGKANQAIGAISFTPATLTVGGTTTVSVTATSGLAVTFTSATPSICTVSGTTLTGVTAGTCTITADQAGNATYLAATSISQNLTVVYSATPPVLTISTLADGSITNNATLNVSGQATSINGITSVTVNGAPVTLAADGTFSQAVTLQAGTNTVTTIATDNAGTTTSDSRSVTLDTTAPVIIITAPADNGTLAASSATVTGTVDKNATVQATVNDGSAQSAAMDGTSFTVTLNLAEGSNTIAVSATDLAGNSASVKRTITSDTTKPTLAITDPAQDITTSEPTLTVTGTVSDALTDVSVTITCDGKSYTPQTANGAFQQQLTFATAKQYAITVTATDQAGNSVTTQRNVIYALSSLPTGDINNDGKVDIADALLALRVAVGIVTPNQAQLAAGDVAPLVNGKPAPDGVIDIADAMLILEKAVGILTW